MKKIKLNGDVFIVPNGLVDRDTSWFPEKYDKICSDNNVMNNKLMVQVWITGKPLSDNFSDHGVYFKLNDIEYRVRPGIIPSYIPLQLLENKKEGDKISFIIKGCHEYDCPKLLCKEDKDEGINKIHLILSPDFKKEKDEGEVELLLELTLNQKDYRYRRFGTFEETLEQLLNQGGYIND